MADPSNKMTLDKAGLRSFIDNDLLPFLSDMDKMGKDDPKAGAAMVNLTKDGTTGKLEKEFYEYTSFPLAIGQLGASSGAINAKLQTAGNSLNTAVENLAQSVADIITQQKKLFNDLHDNLETTLSTLFDSQDKNLESIDGASFLDALQDAENDMQNTSTGSSGSSTGSGSTS